MPNSIANHSAAEFLEALRVIAQKCGAPVQLAVKGDGSGVLCVIEDGLDFVCNFSTCEELLRLVQKSSGKETSPNA